VIIIASTCADGHGGDSFYNTFAKANSVQNVIDEIMVRNRNKTIPDQWESQILARILLKCKVIMVTNASKKMVENMHMKWAASIEEAIEMADEMLGNRGKITIISDGVSVIVR
jgi:nickel-dependent lactate racemase